MSPIANPAYSGFKPNLPKENNAKTFNCWYLPMLRNWDQSNWLLTLIPPKPVFSDVLVKIKGIAEPNIANSWIESKEACGANLLLPTESAVRLDPPCFCSFGLGVNK